MRLIFEVFGRALVFTIRSARAAEPDPEPESGQEPGSYSYSLGCVVEHREHQNAAEVQEFSGAGIYRPPDDTARDDSPGFGFRA